jgi:predicted nucleic acid-binding protein
MWLLDTNAWIAYLERKPNPIKTRIAQTPENQIVMCDIVKAEYCMELIKAHVLSKIWLS